MSDLVLRPRSATELIDAAFQVYRRAPVPFMVAMALIYVPWLAIRLIFQLRRSETPDQITPNLMRSVIFATGAAGIVIYGLAGGVVAVLARAVYLDEPIDVSSALRQTARPDPAAGRRSPRGPFVVIGIGLVLLRRSRHLLRRAILRGAPGDGAGGQGPVRRAWALRPFGDAQQAAHPRHVDPRRDSHDGGERRRRDVDQLQPSKVITSVLVTAVTIVVYPIFGITETVLYFDTRVRNEGFDVEYLASAVTDTIADARTGRLAGAHE